MSEGDKRTRTEPITLPSYAKAFDLERKFTNIKGHPLPRAVPARLVVYVLALGVLLLFLRLVPPVAALMPWWLQLLFAIPAGYVLWAARIAGRPAHQALPSLIRHYLKPRRWVMGRPVSRHCDGWKPPTMLFIAGERSSMPRAVTITGPATLSINRHHRARTRGTEAHFKLRGGELKRSKRYELPAGYTAEIGS